MRYFMLEDLSPDASRSYLLWESAGRTLSEVKLTPEQIRDIFNQIERSAEESGANRTAIGKAKDTASRAKDAVAAAYKDLKNTVYNSKAMNGFAAKYDAAATKIREKLGDDAKVMEYIRRYRDFANKHPIMQTVIYSLIIGAAGLSGFGIGGMALIGLFKAFDRLILGDDVRTALWAGTKTFAIGMTVGQILSYLGIGQPAPEKPAAATTADAGSGTVVPVSTGRLARESLDILKDSINSGYITDYNMFMRAMRMAVEDAAKELGVTQTIRLDAARRMLDAYIDTQVAQANGGSWSGSGPQRIAEFMRIMGAEVPEGLERDIGHAAELRRRMTGIRESEGIELNEAAIKDLLSNTIAWINTKGKNLTTKLTADKLETSWQKAGSPTDSSRIARWLNQTHGIPEAQIRELLLAVGVDEKDADSSLPTAPEDLPPEEVPFKSGNKDLDAEAEEIFREKGKDAFVTWWENKTSSIEQQMAQTRLMRFTDAIKKQDVATAIAMISSPTDLPNAVKTAMKTAVVDANISDSAKADLLRRIGKNKGHWVKESEYRQLSRCLSEASMSWNDLGILLVAKHKITGRMILI